jgi:rhodanese-related sulfurtransferase
MTYAGDVSSVEAWDALTKNADSVLVDVRSSAEFAFVGVPDLSSIGRDLHQLPIREFPDMSPEPDFIDRLRSAVSNSDTKIYFLCRTGGRSREAAEKATAAGYSNCYNVSDGFEGDVDGDKHRGNVNGWKASKLPWRQG